MILDESSAHLSKLEETHDQLIANNNNVNPNSNQHPPRLHDDNTVTSSQSVSDVYNEVNALYIRRTEELRHSMEQTTKQNILIHKKKLLQQYWAFVQVSVSIHAKLINTN